MNVKYVSLRHTNAKSTCIHSEENSWYFKVCDDPSIHVGHPKHYIPNHVVEKSYHSLSILYINYSVSQVCPVVSYLSSHTRKSTISVNTWFRISLGLQLCV